MSLKFSIRVKKIENICENIQKTNLVFNLIERILNEIKSIESRTYLGFTVCCGTISSHCTRTFCIANSLGQFFVTLFTTRTFAEFCFTNSTTFFSGFIVFFRSFRCFFSISLFQKETIN